MADAKQLRLFMPHMWMLAGVNFTNTVIDGTGDSMGIGFEPANVEAITHVGLRIATTTGTVTNLATVGLETVNGTGIPTGTDVGTTLTTFTPSTATGNWQWIQLANSFTPSTPGELIALVVRGLSGLSTADCFLVSRNDSNANSMAHNRPYVASQSAGTWGAIVQSNCVFAIRTANTRYGVPLVSLLGTRSPSTVGNRLAVYFTVSTALGASYTLAGIRGQISPAAAVNKSPLLGLWDSSGAVQGSTKVIDSDQFLDAAQSIRDTTFYYVDNPLPTLSCGTEYYAGLETADAANGGIVIRGIQLQEDADKLCYSGGTAIGLAMWSTASSAWIKDTSFNRPFVELILKDITPATSTSTGGGSGGAVVKVHPGMAGGMRG